ncbi:MAG: hypothetical protein FWD67_05375 [Betaproteobacteria bacterium]|nr:hypothetical protein [Betaproteobacteria bacterium]
MIHRFCAWLAQLRASRRGRKHALALAEDLSRRLRPDEPIWATTLRADEDARYVVCVYYCGDAYKEMPIKTLGPPWHECLIIAVAKDNGAATLMGAVSRLFDNIIAAAKGGEAAAELAEDVAPYRPIIR